MNRQVANGMRNDGTGFASERQIRTGFALKQGKSWG
jgi:hypothetical protein